MLIPDVQKLINQLGNVNTDLFASRLLRPPSSVLLLPLRASGVGECHVSSSEGTYLGERLDCRHVFRTS